MAIPEGTDGEHFINVYSKGATPLGQWLSNFAKQPFDHPIYGSFQSVEGFWYWLSRRKEGGSPDDRLRELSGYQAKQLGESLPGRAYFAHMSEFNALICEAIDLKLSANPAMRKMFVESELPFAHFYEYRGKSGINRIDAGYGWIVEHLEKRRAEMKAKGEVQWVNPQPLPCLDDTW